MEDIARNDEIFDSYGKKCNSRFLLNYGFIVRYNDANEFPIKIYYNQDDQHIEQKKEMINDWSEFRKFRVQGNFSIAMYEFISWVRFVEFDENYAVLIDI
jgi:histone-lysine N-methyltransferase SETD3